MAPQPSKNKVDIDGTPCTVESASSKQIICRTSAQDPINTTNTVRPSHAPQLLVLHFGSIPTPVDTPACRNARGFAGTGESAEFFTPDRALTFR